MAKIELKVGGMACEGCADAVTRAVKTVDAGAAVTVDLPSKTVSISGSSTREALSAAIAKAGYDIL